jgi:hypothetical protein
MLADPLVLKDSAGSDVTFKLQSTITDPKTLKTTTKRTDASRSAAEPRVLEIIQSVTGTGINRVRRTNVKLYDTQLSTAGVPSTLTFVGAWVFPLNGEHSTTDLDDSITVVADLFLSTASLAVDSSKRSDLLLGLA